MTPLNFLIWCGLILLAAIVCWIIAILTIHVQQAKRMEETKQPLRVGAKVGFTDRSMIITHITYDNNEGPQVIATLQDRRSYMHQRGIR